MTSPYKDAQKSEALLLKKTSPPLKYVSEYFDATTLPVSDKHVAVKEKRVGFFYGRRFEATPGGG